MKRIVQQLVLCLFTLSIMLPAWGATFPDVDAKHPAARAIDLLTDRKIMSGVTYERFGGDLDFNRFQMAESLNILLGNRQVPETVIILISDVLPNSPQYQTVSKILRANLMSPMDNGRFEGLRFVTRYEFADALQRFLGYVNATPPVGREKKISFRDVKPNYQQAVDQFTNLWQITEGYPNGQFRGDNRVTRFEAAIMLGKVASLLYEDIKAELAKEPEPTLAPEETPAPAGSSSGSTALEELLNASPSAPPSVKPSAPPSVKPSAAPSAKPSSAPSAKPSSKPTTAPSAKPSTQPSAKPSAAPSSGDSRLSDLEALLNGQPSGKPSAAPSGANPSSVPTIDPGKLQGLEGLFGSPKPTAAPTVKPSAAPTAKPTVKPSVAPSAKPTAKPTAKPSAKPSAKPTAKPSAKPSPKPTAKPSAKPSAKPTAKPSVKPSAAPSAKPSAATGAVIAPTPAPSASLNSALSELEKQFNQLRSTPTPTPQATQKPAQTDTLVQVPLPSAQPTPTPTPLPSVQPVVVPSINTTTALRSRVLLLGNYRALYEERVPPNILSALSMPATNQTISGDAGLSANLNTLIWFGAPNTLGGNIGAALDIGSLGGYTFNDANMTDIIWVSGGPLYKLLSSPNFDFAAGLDGYFRLTDSSNDPRNNYFQAARSYIGLGARMIAAYRIIEPLSLELTISPHYVMQDLGNIDLPNELPLNRLDAQIQFMVNWDMFEIGTSRLSLNVGYQGLLLFDLGSEASQMMHGGLFGLGYHF
ncbi:MAG: S-layer homology domain-containing protein [Candidatus Sericytochromatia bacterium]